MAQQKFNLEQAGDYQLDKCELISYRKNDENKLIRVDVIPIIVNIELTEDINSNNMVGVVSVFDTQDIRSVLPITGLEKLALKFSTSGMPDQGVNADDESGGYPFQVYKIDSISLQERQGRAQVYRIFFCSQEAYFDSISRVSRAYDGPIENAIIDIFQNKKFLNSKKPLIYEPTKSNVKVVIPNLRPYEAINWMSCHTEPSKYSNASGYHFYETPKGWFYRSLESMLGIYGVGARPPVWNYQYQSANTRDDKGLKTVEKDMHSVFKYDFKKPVNTLFNLREGMYCSKLLIHDAFNKIFKELDFNYHNDFDKKLHTEVADDGAPYTGNNKYSLPNTKWEDTNKTLTDNPDAYTMFSSNTDKIHDKNKVIGKKMVQGLISQMMAMNSIQLDLLVPGNSLIQAGDIIEFDLPVMRPLGEKRQETNPWYSGRYLVMSIKHNISQVDGMYQMTLKCHKDALMTPFEAETENTELEVPDNKGKQVSLYDIDYRSLNEQDPTA